MPTPAFRCASRPSPQYGLAFKERMVPELEDKLVVSIDRLPDGFIVRLDDGETLKACQVVLAVGITHFEYTSPESGAPAAGIALT